MCPRSHDKGPEAEEGVELQEGECLRGPRGLRPAPRLQAGDAGRPRAPAERTPFCPAAPTGGDGPGAEEQTAVAIASVQQAAFGDHNIQYQFRTENNGGQVRRLRAGSPEGPAPPGRAEGGRTRAAGRGEPPTWPPLRPPASVSPLCRPLQVTYRVVQVTDGQLDGQGDAAGAVSVVSTAAFAGGQQAVTQVGVDGAAQRPGPAAASVPPGPAAPFPLVGGPASCGEGLGRGKPQGVEYLTHERCSCSLGHRAV